MEVGQARRVGKEGWEPPNTSKMHRATGEVGGEPGQEPRTLPQLRLAGTTARQKRHQGETPGTECCRLC